MTEDEVLALLHKKAKALGSAAALARELGVSPQYLHDVMGGKRPGTSILDALNLERVTTYRKAGGK